jgi:branched-chain amino acid transport system permease protein
MTAVAAQSSTRRSLARFRWPIGYVVVIVFLFLLYQTILPSLVKSVSAPVIAWLPVATLNECLMWAIMALGLNVVVGYAGLLDLGYVAFWALGGYTAGWLMAYPFNCSPRFRPRRRALTSTSGWSSWWRACSARSSA